jgi:RNA polymerase sigma-70 factor, ECF subfamily
VTSSLEVTTKEGDVMPVEVASLDHSPFEHVAHLESTRVLVCTLRALMPHYCEILKLRFVDELSLSEISRITGAPVSTVKARLYRALTALKPRMQANSRPASRTLQLAS